MEPKQPDYRHMVRLALLVIAIAVVAVILRTLAVPDSFGELGHYRADALDQARDFEPRHVGREVCGDCHDDVVALHAKDAHAGVACESCHGPGAAHVDDGGEGGIRRPSGTGPCLVCHRYMPSRPGDFPQIVQEEHFRFVGVADPTTECIACHDPHEPLYMDRDLRTARLHPLVHRCRDCHTGRNDDTLPRPAGHPEIFTCDYCHGEITRSFAVRPHSGVRCSTCHLFFKESDSAGRMLRDTDPRFCLLCHREADFRSDEAPPSIEWPDHRADMADGPADLAKRCTDCHQDRIHTLPTRDGSRGAAP